MSERLCGTARGHVSDGCDGRHACPADTDPDTGVRAAFPLELPMTRAALLLLLIFGLTGWAEMAG